MRKISVAITLLLALLGLPVVGTASASPADKLGAAATVNNVTPLVTHFVCADSLRMRGSPGGGALPGKTLHHGDVVETLQWDGAWVLIEAINPPIGRGWVVGRYLC